MQQLEYFLNAIQYQLLRWEKFTQNIIIYPIYFIFRNKKVKEIYKKKGVDDPEGLVKDTLNDSINGISNFNAGAITGSLITLFFLGLSILFVNCVEEPYQKWFIFIFSLVPGLLISFKFIFNEKIYIPYFKEFDKKPKVWQRKWAWITFIFVVLILSFTIVSFWILTQS